MIVRYEITYRFDKAWDCGDSSSPLNIQDFHHVEMTDEEAIEKGRKEAETEPWLEGWLVSKYYFPVDENGKLHNAIKREVIAQSDKKSHRLDYNDYNKAKAI